MLFFRRIRAGLFECVEYPQYTISCLQKGMWVVKDADEQNHIVASDYTLKACKKKVKQIIEEKRQ